MLSLDDRAGNVMTTLAVFLAAAAILYLGRGAFFILLLSVLFAYLLEPAVLLVQQHSWIGKGSRTWAITQIYLIGLLVLGLLAYEFGPHFVRQIKNLHAAIPKILQNFSDEKSAADLGAKHGLSGDQQERIREWLVGNHDLIVRVSERAAASAGYLAARAVWLFVVPILAIFVLRDGRNMLQAIVDLAGRGGEARAERIVKEIDAMLARYIRAQFVLAALSFLFYSVSMWVLGFPYAVALGFLGGALEFLPAVGWIASAATILTTGFLTHAHWIWMAGLLLLWRVVQDYVNSPRIMGNNLGLQPLTVLAALMVGGQVGGIAGLYLSVPTVAVLRILATAYLAPKGPSRATSDKPLAEVEA